MPSEKDLLHKYFTKLGRKGGTETLKKHGAAQMREWGKLGGRPKAKKGKKHGKRSRRRSGTGAARKEA